MGADGGTRAERAGRMLAEAAEIMLGAMRTLAVKLEAAETPEAAQAAALALQRANRGLRQTLLLESRLEIEAAKAAERGAAEAAKAHEAEVAQRKLRVRLAVGREVYEACDSREDGDEMMGEIEDCLDDYVRGHFDDLTVEALVALLIRDLGLEGPDEACDEADDQAAEAPDDPAPDAPVPPAPPRLIQQPDLGWSPAPNSS